ncbi:hypothetical protein ACEE21_15050 [Clostridium baratii]
MLFRYRTECFNGTSGDCLVIRDTMTGDNVELTRVQADSILARLKGWVLNGEFPHAVYTVNGKVVTIQHCQDSKNHSLNIDINDLQVIVRNNVGVIN